MLKILENRDCPECGADVPFERVECADGHGEDCPDRACVGCGLALVVGPVWLTETAAVGGSALSRT